MQNLKNNLLRTKFEIGFSLRRHTSLFYLWRKLFRPDTAERLLSNHTEIVIEGFPRSGNTFAVAAFKLAQNRPVTIAHHSHKIVQVAKGVKARLPTNDYGTQIKKTNERFGTAF